MEFNRARREARGVKVISLEAVPLPKKKKRSISAWTLALLKQEQIKQVKAGYGFPLGTARLLEKNGIQVQVVSGALFPQRAVKSRNEINAIAETQQSAVIALRAAVRAIHSARVNADGLLYDRTGILTSERIRRLIEQQSVMRNCTARDTIVACGPASADPHAQGYGPLQAGQPIVIDIFPRHNLHGYWGDLTRTVVKGKPSGELMQMYRAVKAAQHSALEKIKPRVHGTTIHRVVHDEFRKRGYTTDMKTAPPFGFIHGTGHGVGLDIHEPPAVSTRSNVLRKGHVITVEPGLYYPDIGGIRIEDTVAVTATGWRYLYPCEKTFVIS
jgi:Xaa-Pro aminopeptidase